MADEAKHCSPIHSTSEALVVQRMVRCCHGEELALSVDQYWLQALQFFSAFLHFAEYVSQM